MRALRPYEEIFDDTGFMEHIMTPYRVAPPADGHPKRGPRRCLWLGAALALADTVGTAAAATHLQIERGRSYMGRSGATAVFVEAVLAERPIGSSRLSWSPDCSVGWIDGRSIEHFRYSHYATDNASWIVASGVRLRAGGDKDWYHPLFFSFQPALHSGTTMALSSVYELVSTLGWQGRRFSFQIRHISNGSLRGSHWGETMVLVGVGLDLWR